MEQSLNTQKKCQEGYWISGDVYDQLNWLGLIPNDVRKNNIGTSDYSLHTIQPWSIWLDYHLNPWDADIIKRILRTKKESGISEQEARIMDYEKIIHICKERIRQISDTTSISNLGSD